MDELDEIIEENTLVAGNTGEPMSPNHPSTEREGCRFALSSRDH